MPVFTQVFPQSSVCSRTPTSDYSVHRQRMWCWPHSRPIYKAPLPAFIVSPFSVVPKKQSGRWHFIMHLSFTPGCSINDGIDVTDFPLRYSTVFDAMDSLMLLGRHSLMAKLDIIDAFCLCPIHPQDYHLLGSQWKGQYFYERVLPFSCAQHPTFSTA